MRSGCSTIIKICSDFVCIVVLRVPIPDENFKSFRAFSDITSILFLNYLKKNFKKKASNEVPFRVIYFSSEVSNRNSRAIILLGTRKIHERNKNHHCIINIRHNSSLRTESKQNTAFAYKIVIFSFQKLYLFENYSEGTVSRRRTRAVQVWHVRLC